MKPLAPILPLLLLAGCGADVAEPPARDDRPQRIVSLNLCADQLLLALADRNQVAALTALAADPAMSAGAARARGWPTSRGGAEDIVALHPDLVIAAPGMRGAEAAAAAGQRFATLELPPADSFAAIADQVRSVARAVGHPERAEPLLARMSAELAAIPRTPGAGIAAHYQKRGWMTGGGTLVDAIMARAGLTNLATRLGKPALAQVSLEEIVAAQPDWLIVDSASGAGGDDQGAEMLRHPAIAAIPRLTLDGAATVCGGPATVDAAADLARQVAAARGRASRHSASRTPATALRGAPTTPNTSS